MGPIESKISEKVGAEFKPEHMVLENESHSHSVPRNSETHFKLLLVSEKFRGLNRVARQRLVYSLLQEEMSPGRVHALSLRLLAPEEWAVDAANSFQSPACHGGSKREGI
jgi:stress-induced morphogen